MTNTMHTIRNALAAPLLLPCILLAQPAYEWRADLATREVANLYPRHGETAPIRCTLTRAGAPYVPESVSASVSTNGVWGDGWPAPATSASNVVTVSWGPELDPGAETLCLRIHVDGIHRPAAILHLGPGGGGSTLPPPGTVIDFAETRYVNEPWATRDELRDATNALVIAAVDLSPYATWQGLDDATNAAAAEVAEVAAAIAGKADARRRIDAWRCEWDGATLHPVPDMPGALRKYTADARDTTDQRMLFFYPADGWTILDDTWYLYPQDGQSAPIACEAAPDAAALVFERGESQYRLDLVEERAAYMGDIPSSPADIGAASADGLSGLSAELEAIRAAADEIALPEDPTAAELGAAFRDLLMCIKNPQRARATLRATRGDAR